jgi:hypothetical protein
MFCCKKWKASGLMSTACTVTWGFTVAICSAKAPILAIDDDFPWARLNGYASPLFGEARTKIHSLGIQVIDTPVFFVNCSGVTSARENFVASEAPFTLNVSNLS